MLSEIARMMAAAEQARGRYVQLADRAARLYAPVVHALGLTTFTGWMLAGAGWERALEIAISVLIITCPCALALAVPVVQVAACSRLFGRGTIVKAADGLERLAEADTVVFDKTGTLTYGVPRLAATAKVEAETLARAASLAAVSRHPYSRAIVAAAEARGLTAKAAADVKEVPGAGLSHRTSEGEERLGSAAWCGVADGDAQTASLYWRAPGEAPVALPFEDALRPDAGATIAALRRGGFEVLLLSGDREAAVAETARTAGIDEWHSRAKPDEKIARIKALEAAGRKVVMVGDGLNDAPALAAAHASISPSSAADISQTTADVVFQGSALAPIVETLAVAERARRMAFENFWITAFYNGICIPIAMAGYVTPLIAAVAMSTSSIAVVGNALRLRSMRVALQRPQKKGVGP
jgi:Cu2+-exporting ATPase